ncbi:MAG: hypothetical protein AB1505_13980 [Candidatus Latescibacterota bacterium]
MEQAIPRYQAGADGLAFWDTDGRMLRCSEWAVCRDLGHREEREAWRAQGRGKRYFRQVPLHKVVDWRADRRYWPITNG